MVNRRQKSQNLPAGIALLFVMSLTFSADARASEVNLLAMGDWGSNGPDQRAVAATMKSYLQHTGRKFDAMLLAGDNFYVPLENIFDPKWRSMFEDLYDPSVFDFPFYPVMGNHDYRNTNFLIELAYSKSNPRSRWKFPARWYRVDLPARPPDAAAADDAEPLVTVIMLDSDMPVVGDVEWKRELDWLKKELAKPRAAKWLVCVAHHPLFSNGDHGDNGILQRTWGPLFEKAGVDFYICGHDHDVQHLELVPRYPSFLMVGGGG